MLIRVSIFGVASSTSSAFISVGGTNLHEANFGLGWGLVGPTGGSDSGEGREPLLPSAVGPEGRKRLA